MISVIYILILIVNYIVKVNQLHYSSSIEIDIQNKTLFNSLYFYFILNNKEIYLENKDYHYFNKDLTFLNYFTANIYYKPFNMYKDKLLKPMLISLNSHKIDKLAYSTFNLPNLVYSEIFLYGLKPKQVNQGVDKLIDKIKPIIEMLFRIEIYIIKSNIAFIKFFRNINSINNKKLIKENVNSFIIMLNGKKERRSGLIKYAEYLKNKLKEYEYNLAYFLIDEFNILLRRIVSLKESVHKVILDIQHLINNYKYNIDVTKIKNNNFRIISITNPNEDIIDIMIGVLFRVSNKINKEFTNIKIYEKEINIHKSLLIFHRIKQNILNSILKNYKLVCDVILLDLI